MNPLHHDIAMKALKTASEGDYSKDQSDSKTHWAEWCLGLFFLLTVAYLCARVLGLVEEIHFTGFIPMITNWL